MFLKTRLRIEISSLWVSESVGAFHQTESRLTDDVYSVAAIGEWLGYSKVIICI